MVDEHRFPVQPTGPRADRRSPTDLEQRLVASYERRLAAGFVRRVLDAELRRSPALAPDAVEDLVRRRLDDWLVFGRYPLPAERPAPEPVPTPVPGRWSRPDGT